MLIDLTKMETERRNEKTMNLDQLSYLEILTLMNEEDQQVPIAIKKVLPEIERAVSVIVEKFKQNGRLIYTGAGTSGRLGVLDAAECPPTFGTDKNKVIGLIAGGEKAFIEAIEGAEDNVELGADDLKAIHLTDNDVVVGMAASGRTPYVKGALTYAKSIGAKTVSISCNPNSEIGQISDIGIDVSVGPEVLTGSTRLKAGTAQKLILNMISTVSMIGIGKVYQNLMVDVQTTNRKLEERAIQIVIMSTGTTRDLAEKVLKENNFNVKLAIIIILLNVDKDVALKALNNAEGHVRDTINQLKKV